MGKVVWTPENDRKLLIRLIDKSAKSYNSEALCQLFEGATPKAIEERIAKLKREAKALDARCAVQPSSPHKPKGNYYTAPPVPGQAYRGVKRTITQVQENGKDEDQEGGKGVDVQPRKKAKSAKKKKKAAATTAAEEGCVISTTDLDAIQTADLDAIPMADLDAVPTTNLQGAPADSKMEGRA
ncbi:hypothetical protein H072_5056 [Dactylellina haptotyla CBS 200.50]|uniref:Myb-like domain-containing protein n=1 Tax=Dactylellina haptotyla (strain CBS 200.50) TaxID=1284197 RepID=S8ADM7_DACHA|nr:hypothetical protein H072_5056 [Dactylellina haptotyla CBS 200.50]